MKKNQFTHSILWLICCNLKWADLALSQNEKRYPSRLTFRSVLVNGSPGFVKKLSRYQAILVLKKFNKNKYINTYICFEMATTTKSLSASFVGTRFGVTEKIARLFMLKVREAMKSSENHPLYVTVHVDEYGIGCKEESKVGRSYDSKKKKMVCAEEITNKGKVKRMYFIKTDNYSAKELGKIYSTI